MRARLSVLTTLQQCTGKRTKRFAESRNSLLNYKNVITSSALYQSASVNVYAAHYNIKKKYSDLKLSSHLLSSIVFFKVSIVLWECHFIFISIVFALI